MFSKDNLKGGSAGVLKFGPSLSDYATFSSGILKSYHEYKITSVLLEYVSEASSTASGSIAYEVDPHCKITELKSTINKFGITKNGRSGFAARWINGLEWHDTSEDQFYIAFQGNGDKATPAGSFKIKMTVSFQNPK